jgi:hypothetical protein
MHEANMSAALLSFASGFVLASLLSFYLLRGKPTRMHYVLFLLSLLAIVGASIWCGFKPDALKDVLLLHPGSDWNAVGSYGLSTSFFLFGIVETVRSRNKRLA